MGLMRKGQETRYKGCTMLPSTPLSPGFQGEFECKLTVGTDKERKWKLRLNWYVLVHSLPSAGPLSFAIRCL